MKIRNDHQQAVHRETRRPLFQKNLRRPLASMTTLALLASLLALSPASLYAQIEFSSGSDGSFGPINVTTGTVTLDPPPDGIFNATTITVAPGATLTFTRNPLNTPIFLLATGDIEITGTIDVSGQNGVTSASGQGGPGGFDGGGAGLAGAPSGDGLGPGGGGGGTNSTTSGGTGAGLGAYGSTGDGALPANGNTYGSPLLVPLVGGSGGGGQPNRGGGGGGGAILLASNTRVNITGSILARGGTAFNVGHGSGGGVRIVAPIVSGNGTVDARGEAQRFTAGAGRIRIDLVDRSQLSINLQGVPSVGAFMQVFPPGVPRLDIVNVAGRAIPVGTQQSVRVLLPFGSPTAQEVTIQARDFSGVVPIAVVLTPDIGPRTVIEVEIDNRSANPVEVVVPVEIPVNVVTHVNVWTR